MAAVLPKNSSVADKLAQSSFQYTTPNGVLISLTYSSTDVEKSPMPPQIPEAIMTAIKYMYSRRKL